MLLFDLSFAILVIHYTFFIMVAVDEPLKRTFQVSVGSVNKSMLYCIFYFAYLLFKIIVLLPVKIGC